MSEDKKKSITVIGNEPKPLLCKVALLLKFRDFMNWVDINQRRRNTLVLIE
jgi:hypothetical protein